MKNKKKKYIVHVAIITFLLLFSLMFFLKDSKLSNDQIIEIIKTDYDINYYFENNDNVSILNISYLSKEDFISLQNVGDKYSQWYLKSPAQNYNLIRITSSTDQKDFLILIPENKKEVERILAIIKIEQ